MPIYTYECLACSGVIEKRQSFTEAPLTACQTCGGQLRKVLHPVGIVFKGSGFYNTDYRGGDGAAEKDKDKAEPAKAAAGDGADKQAEPAKSESGGADHAPEKTPAKSGDGAVTAPTGAASTGDAGSPAKGTPSAATAAKD